MYYFESSQNKFIPSDIGNGTINLVSQLVDKGYGLGIADLENKTGDELNMLFVNARIAKFRKEAPLYWDVEDTLFFNLCPTLSVSINFSSRHEGC